MTYVRSLLLPVIAAALVFAASLASTDVEPPRPPGAVAVTQSTYACPAGATITVASGQIAAGTGATASVLPARTPDEALAGASTWRTSVVDGPGVIVQQRGRASGAVGYFAGTAPKSGGGGLVVGSCPGVVDDAWLLGLGSGNKHFSTLILTNLANSTAAVDLSLWGPSGRIDAVDTEGVVVKPNSVRRIRLDSLAAGESEIAVHVHRRRGSLSAVVNDTSTATYRGTEPISSTLAPRREQVVGGAVAGTNGRTLLILNPGSSTARVTARVIGRNGAFTPSGLDEIKVKAGSMQSVTVPESAGSGELAIRLTSDRPVAATLRMAPGNKDFAYAEASAPLAGPAVVPIDLGPGIPAPELILTAPDSAATVAVEAFDAQMTSVTSTTLRIPAESTRPVQLKVPGAAYVVLRPRGDVIVAATYAKGDGLSSLAVMPAPTSVLAPQVRPVD